MRQNDKDHYSAGFLFLLTITRSGRLKFSRTNGHIPFVRMVKFLFLAHFIVRHLPHPAMSSLILILRNSAHLCDWLFHLNHHITYISYFVASCLFLLRYSRPLRHCFEVQSEEIQFLPSVFPSSLCPSFLMCDFTCMSPKMSRELS